MKPLLTDILSDDAGNPSSMRLALLGSLLIVLSMWAYVSWELKSLQSLPPDIAHLLEVMLAAKVGQKFTEAKASPDQPNQPNQPTQ